MLLADRQYFRSPQFIILSSLLILFYCKAINVFKPDTIILLLKQDSYGVKMCMGRYKEESKKILDPLSKIIP